MRVARCVTDRYSEVRDADDTVDLAKHEGYSADEFSSAAPRQIYSGDPADAAHERRRRLDRRAVSIPSSAAAVAPPEITPQISRTPNPSDEANIKGSYYTPMAVRRGSLPQMSAVGSIDSRGTPPPALFERQRRIGAQGVQHQQGHHLYTAAQSAVIDRSSAYMNPEELRKLKHLQKVILPSETPLALSTI